MKKWFAFLLLLLPTLAMADDTPTFSATDKVLYFNSDVLKDVIKRTFPENLQLNVAQKYVDLMDEKGNMSVADLVAVCDAGGLDMIKCRNFIQDLLATSNSDIKPFYWADYIGKGKVISGGHNSGDGYNISRKSFDLGAWVLKFNWTDNNTFRLAYPGSNAIAGTSACTSDAGTPYVPDNTKNYAPNTQTGEHCWCKMTGPEEAPWVYLEDIVESNRTYGLKSTCARSCSLSCLNAMYGTSEIHSTNMQKAIFTAVKLNKSNASVVIDDTLASDLTNEFKPREFIPEPVLPQPYQFVQLDSRGYAYQTGGVGDYGAARCRLIEEGNEEVCRDQDHDKLIITNANKRCYIADKHGADDYCQEHVVCVLGKAFANNDIIESPRRVRFERENACWRADTKEFLGHDDWFPESPLNYCSGGNGIGPTQKRPEQTENWFL